MNAVVVLDSFAMLAFMNKQPGAERVRDLLVAAEESKITLVMSAINAGEVYYILAKRKSLSDAQVWKDQMVPVLPIRFEVPTFEGIFRAAEMKARYAIAYADAFAASLALRYEASLVTGDPEFKAIPDLRLDWIG